MDERALEEVKRLYDMLPTIECKGLCWNSCGPIDMSTVERERIEGLGVEIQPFTPERVTGWHADEPLHCAALTEDKRCAIYEARPLICRLWGVAESMPCPHGCKVTPRMLDDETAMEMLAYSIQVGGGADTVTAKEMGEVMNDPVLGPLMKRMMRGDTSVEQELLEAIEARKRRSAG